MEKVMWFIYGGALMFGLLLLTDCVEDFDKHARISRQAQRCEVGGQPLNCMSNSAWALPANRCSCLVRDRPLVYSMETIRDRRIEYRLEDGER